MPTKLNLIIFLILNLFVYIFIYFFHQLIPFDKIDYTLNANHYLSDQRISGGQFDFLNALGQYDAQWYLKIADTGYPKNPQYMGIDNKGVMDGTTYAFFPFYPLILSIFNFIFRNIELSGFVLSWILITANFFSLYKLFTSVTSHTIATKAVFLTLFSPFSIFFRSYYAENLYLLIIIWFSYFLIKKRFILASFCLALSFITKGTGYLLVFVLLFTIFKNREHIKKIPLLLMFLLFILPILMWISFNLIYTGNPFYFILVRNAWIDIPVPVFVLNIALISHFFDLPWHYFHTSKVEIITFFIFGSLVCLSRKMIDRTLLLISTALFLGPLFFTDLMSFSRYQIINFPIFLYLAIDLPGSLYRTLITVFYISLLIIGVFFINWYWIG